MPEAQLFRQWAQAAGMNDVTLGAHAAVSERAIATGAGGCTPSGEASELELEIRRAGRVL